MFSTRSTPVHRSDVLQRAYELVKQNKGSPGLDGVTFERIEEEKGKQEYLLKLCKLEMKDIGKPYAGKPHIRFDEGELRNCHVYNGFAALYSL